MNLITRIIVPKIKRPNCLKLSSSSISKKIVKPSTVDNREIEHFSKLSDVWWNSGGELRALHNFNALRIELVRRGLAETGFRETNPGLPLEGLKILDVGCGGGILTEALAKIGADITGLDATAELVCVAKEHAALDTSLTARLKYAHSTIEDFSRGKEEEYDVVVASEIIEHVADPELFIRSCVEVLKPNGSIFLTTINKNFISWLGAILLFENILGVIPKGTHEWKKFISPEETRKLLSKYNCSTRLVRGILLNPWTRTWSWISSDAIFYALHAVKENNSQKK